MTTYAIKRLLLMIPTFIGISFVIWFLVTSAPGEPGLSVQGEAQSQEGAGGGESRRIFRAQFNLDKPTFWNHYPGLDTEEVLEAVSAVADRSRELAERNEAWDQLEDWGYFAVPHLVDALDATDDQAVREAIITRLSRNAKRIAPATLGRSLTEEDRRRNREILTENSEIKLRLSIRPGRTSAEEVDAKAELWKAWLAERRDRWDWSFGERMRIRLFDTQFAAYWANLVRIDFGYSHVHRQPVTSLIGQRIRVSVALAVTSLILAYLLAVPIGVWAAVNHKSWPEKGMSTILFMLFSLPSFFAAALVLRYLGVGLDIIPVQGFESENTFEMTTWQHLKDIAAHVIAPIACMTYTSLAVLSRYAKTGLLDVIRSDYVRTARAKGLSEKVVVLKHALRNGVIPIITLLGTTLPVLVGGSIVIETVFRIPGIGFLMWDSILQRDYNVVIGVGLISASLTMLGILLADVLYAIVDPRISFE